MLIRVSDQFGVTVSQSATNLTLSDVEKLCSTHRELEIKSPAFTPLIFSALCKKLPRLPLDILILNKFFISPPQWIELLSSIQSCQTLTELDLSFNKMGTSQSKLVEAITALTQLKTLKLYNLSLTETEKAALLQALSSHPSLETVVGVALTEEVQKQLTLNKKFNSIELILAELAEADTNNKLSLPLLRLKSEELFGTFKKIDFRTSPKRRNEVLSKIYYRLGCWFNQKGQTTLAATYFERVLQSPQSSPFKERTREQLAALYFTQASDPNLDPLKKIALLEQTIALNDPLLVDYANKALLGTYNAALTALKNTELKISQDKFEVEQRLATSPSYLSRYPQPAPNPNQRVSVCSLPTSPKAKPLAI